MDSKITTLRVEVAYARSDKQRVIAVRVAPGCTIRQAIEQSGVLIEFPEIKLTRQKVGVFSKARQLTDLVNDGDRIEIYRALIIDPKEARRAKAKKMPKA